MGKIVHYDPKAVEVPEGFPKAFPFRGMHFFASIEKAKQDVPNWTPKYSLLDGLTSSYCPSSRPRPRFCIHGQYSAHEFAGLLVRSSCPSATCFASGIHRRWRQFQGWVILQR